MTERVAVVVNPAAGRGRGARMLESVTRSFADAGVTEVSVTAKPGDEIQLTERAIDAGATTIVVVGGDGTTNHVANVILRSGSDARLAVLPAGTGNDFAKVTGTGRIAVRDLIELVESADDVRVDVGRIDDRYFLNSCGFAFDVAVLESSLRNRWLRGSAVYIYSALTQLLGFPGLRLALDDDAEPSLHLLLVIANSPYFGGRFRIAPDALVTDGMLDSIAIAEASLARRVGILAAAMGGKHSRYRECSTDRARTFNVSFDEPPLYQTDGELHRAESSDLRVTSCPEALRVVVAPGIILR
ncbi:MAG: diacylglycerol kinase family protein [Gemmatimonadaceae bacterium]